MNSVAVHESAKVSRIRIAKVPVDCLSLDQAAEELCRRVESRSHTHVVFVNAAKVVKYGQEPGLRQAMEDADLLFADGMPLVWASRCLRRPLPGRVNGTDLMERMVGLASSRGYRVFFLGARPHVIEKTVREFQRRHPELQVAGFHHGYFAAHDNDSVIDLINDSGADLLLVGMSTPAKEVWGHQNLQRLKVPVVQGVGGSFDVVAGMVSRAPVWMQKSGTEWFYRFMQEPRRMWRRYLTTNSRFLLLIFAEWLAATRSTGRAAPDELESRFPES